MTSKSVTEISALFGTGISTKAGGTGKTGMSSSFNTVLSSTSSGQKNALPEENGSKAPIRTDSSSVRKSLVQDSQKSAADDKTPMDEKIQKATDKIAEQIEDVLDISEEELKAAMETLGLVMTDLLDSEKVTGLVAELTQTTDSMTLLTDEGLYTDLKEILGTVEDVSKELLTELGMTSEEFAQALEAALPEQKTAQEQPVGETEISPNHEKASVETEIPEEPRVIVVKETETGQVEKPVVSSEKTPDTEEISDRSILTEKKDTPSGNQEMNDQGFLGNGNGQGFQDMFLKNMTAAAEQVSEGTTADTEQILKQIQEQIKIVLKPDTTSMEMQLNPASLGRVGLQIEQRAGGITAQFTAQNEAVKAAIENQVVQLKENLENQGIKVDSVEVTIASHEFERNLEQDNHDSTNQKKDTGRVGRRRLNLNAGEELEEEELSGEEELARKIMIDNGNSVDYIA